MNLNRDDECALLPCVDNEENGVYEYSAKDPDVDYFCKYFQNHRKM